MKKTTILFAIVLFFISCEKKDVFPDPENNDDIKPSLNITYSNWYLTRTNYGGGMVNLRIIGSTNGDKVTVRTYGDGLISDYEVRLDSKKNFDEDVVISFTATSVPGNEFELSTKVKAYKGADTLAVTLKSGKLKY